MAFAVWIASKVEGTGALPDIASMRKADILSLPWFVRVAPLGGVFPALSAKHHRNPTQPDVVLGVRSFPWVSKGIRLSRVGGN